MRKFAIYIDEDELKELYYKRFNDVYNKWGSEEKSELFEQFVNFAIECANCSDFEMGLYDIETEVDNYLINGEIVSLEEFCIGGSYERDYNIFDGNWEEFCNYNGIIFNDKYCLIRL